MPEAHPILTCKESATFEKELLGTDERKIASAMDRVGELLGNGILEDFRELKKLPENPKILVLAGKGHNTGDAFLGAKQISELYPKCEISVLFALGEGEMRPLVKRAWESLIKTCNHLVINKLEDERSYDICIDGILGMSFSPPLSEALRNLLKKVNNHPHIQLRAAVDLPSGMGETSDDVVFKADFTYATGVFKAPLLDETRRASIGRIRYLDIGFFEKNYPSNPLLREQVLLPSNLEPLKQLRSTTTYKNKQGHLILISGSREFSGAMMMSLKAALQTGLGLLTVCAPESVVPAFSAEVPEAMWVPWPETESGHLSLKGKALLKEKLPKATAILAGPGLSDGEEALQLVCELLSESELPIALDASALKKSVIDAAAKRPKGWGKVLVTPHIGELKRIGGTPENLPEWCLEKQIITLLKGSISKIYDGESIYLSPYGGPVLARGGSGDILSGIVGGLLAQYPEKPLDALCRALVWHGMSADALAREEGQIATTTTHLLNYMGSILRA